MSFVRHYGSARYKDAFHEDTNRDRFGEFDGILQYASMSDAFGGCNGSVNKS